jgi:hypothetical protein
VRCVTERRSSRDSPGAIQSPAQRLRVLPRARAIFFALLAAATVAHALVAVLLVVPAALIVVNARAARPAHAATRIRPAPALRTE